MPLASPILSLSILIIFYTYVIYPVMVGLAARARGRTNRRDPAADRSVTIILAVYNEEASIARRLAEFSRSLESSGPRGEIVVVSDGSTDGTVERARAFGGERVRIVELPVHLGKAEALNAGFRAARHEILVFADARQTWAEDTLRYLLENFADPAIGAVGGDIIMQSAPGVLAGVGLYWRYEKWLRRQESRLDSTVGVSGSISAVRRVLFRPIPRGTILDDVYWPLRVVMEGFRVVHDERAVAFDRLPDRPRDEFRRKIRTQSGIYQLVARLPSVLSPRRNRVWFQFLSHKLGRLAVPWAMVAILVSSLTSPGLLYGVVFWSEVGFVLVGLAGLRKGAASRLRLVSVACSFLILNAAAWLAFWVWIMGRASRSWAKVDYGDVSRAPGPNWEQASRVGAYPENPCCSTIEARTDGESPGPSAPRPDGGPRDDRRRGDPGPVGPAGRSGCPGLGPARDLGRPPPRRPDGP